ncbi:MAG: porin family protein [Bacteroidales bacterium]|nr:porin family protein [Bacteroidales bacterium]
MKKLLFIVFLLITTLSGYAKVKISGGPKVGLNIATLTKSTDNKAYIGAVAGGFLNLRFSPLFALQPEILFSMQGNKEKIWETDDWGNFVNSNFTISQKLYYLQIPVMAKFYTIKDFYLEAGPQFGILLNANMAVEI